MNLSGAGEIMNVEETKLMFINGGCPKCASTYSYFNPPKIVYVSAKTFVGKDTEHMQVICSACGYQQDATCMDGK